MISAPQTQKHLSATIDYPHDRRLIRAAFATLRSVAKQRGIRLTEGRRRRNLDGSITVDFVVVQRRG